jgi:hypothetical protein
MDLPVAVSDIVLVRLRQVRASGRVSDVVLGVALDVQPYAGDLLSAADYRRLVALVGDAVARATVVGLARLSEELARAISECDPDLITRLAGLELRTPRLR